MKIIERGDWGMLGNEIRKQRNSFKVNRISNAKKKNLEKIDISIEKKIGKIENNIAVALLKRHE